MSKVTVSKPRINPSFLKTAEVIAVSNSFKTDYWTVSDSVEKTKNGHYYLVTPRGRHQDGGGFSLVNYAFKIDKAVAEAIDINTVRVEAMDAFGDEYQLSY